MVADGVSGMNCADRKRYSSSRRIHRLKAIAAVTISRYFIKNFTHELFNVCSTGEAWSRYIQDPDGMRFDKGAEPGAPLTAWINVQTRPIHLVCPFQSSQRSSGQLC